MKIKITVSALMALTVALLAGCESKREPNKIVDGPTINTSQTVIPGKAAQQFILLERDLLKILTPVINKLILANQSFNEVQQVGPGQYTFQTADSRYGTASYTITFQTTGGTTIDPIANRSSTGTLTNVAVSGSGSNALFSFTENLSLNLDAIGDYTAKRHMTGTIGFTGSGYILTFTHQAPGSNATFDNLTDGIVTATGPGPTATANLTLSFSASHEVNGTISWEGITGGLHLQDNGDGFVVTSSERLLIN